MIVLEQVDTGFDSNHRPVVATHSGGGSIHSVVQTSYDALGRTDCVAQRMNPAAWLSLPASACTPQTAGTYGPDRIGRTIRNAAGETIEVQTAVGTALQAAEQTATYTSNGRPLTLTDGMNNRTSYSYDGHDRLRHTYLPVTAQGSNASNAADYEELGYDAAGNVVTRRNRAGETASYTFDALNRTVLKDLPGAEPDISYAYDLLGRLTSASRTGHALTFTYDALGRQLSQTGPQGTYSSLFDSAGRRTRLTHPDGFFVTYEHLVTGEMSAIRENGGFVLASFGYDTRGRRISLTRGNDAVTNYAWDAASRLETLSHDFAGTAHDVTLSFAYNPVDRSRRSTRSKCRRFTSQRPPFRTSLPPDLHRKRLERSGQAAGSAQARSKPNRECDRARVFRMDAVDDIVPCQLGEGPVDRAGCSLDRITLTPGLLDQAPADFGARPPFRLPGPDSAEPAGRPFFDHRKHAESLQRPGSSHRGHAPPGRRPG